MSLPLNPEVVRALGRGDLSPHVANLLANDPYANFEARANHTIAKLRMAREERAALRSTLESMCAEKPGCIENIWTSLSEIGCSIGEFFMSVARWFLSFIKR
jgi:hypothetical protein